MTVEEALKRVKMSIGISPSENIVESHKVISDAIEELKEYREIGTVSEFRELKQKKNPNKPYYVPYSSNPNIGNWHCPACHGIVLYYHRVCGCGKHLDWSEGKE